MNSAPEPSADELRASDADRENAIVRLSEAASDGRLTLAEHAQRVERAYAAQVHGQLRTLTGDLERPAVEPAESAVSSVHRLTAVLGNESRKGRWVVPERLEATSVLGDCHLEMQEALLQQPVTRIDATAILGSVTIFVPEGVDVRLSGRAVLGAKSSQLHARPAPGAPVLDVRCRVVAGTVTVRPPD